MELVNKNNLKCKYSHKYFVILNPYESCRFSNSNCTSENSNIANKNSISSIIMELKENIMIGNIIA